MGKQLTWYKSRALFFYGIGVGGEYPMTATAAMENAVGSGKISTREDRLHRGRKVTLAFLMQGWGQFFNQIILILLLLIFHVRLQSCFQEAKHCGTCSILILGSITY